MSDSGRAVFLSYASQDAEAARRICEALRSGGVEVWFDADGGLEHGDEWDAKIRKQIKECVLFIPVISANTQARHEGYFRIEWELAAQRALGIASGIAFILPVVIDETREPEALVPDRFRTVQWMKLPGGVVTPEVKARYLKLWSHRIGALKPAEMELGLRRPGERGEGAAAPANQPASRRVPAAAWVGAFVVAAAVLSFIAFRPMPNAGATARPPAVAEKAAPPISEARRLVLQARALIDDDWLAVRENFRNADDLCERATKLDPLDGEAWGTWARVAAMLIDRDYDRSRERRDAARSRAERAVQLAPTSIESGLAMALVLAQNNSVPDATQRLRDLLQRAPLDRRVARALAFTYSPGGQPGTPEGTEIRLHHASFGGRDPRPLIDEARSVHDTSRQLWRCEELLEQANALGPCWESYAMGLGYNIYSVVDLDAAVKLAQELPPRLLQEDVFAVLVAKLWMARGDGDKARAALARVPRDFIEDRWFFVPTAFLVGDSYQLSGRLAAAAEQWKQALAVTEKRLLAEPNHPSLLANKAQLLAKLGRKEEALSIWRLRRELGNLQYAASIEARIHLANGDREEAIQRLVRTYATVREQLIVSLNMLRIEPDFAPIRSDPRIAEIITKTEAMVARLRRKPDAPGAKTVRVPPATAPDAKSVAVLAFDNRSDDKEAEYFSDGISDELIAALQRVPGLTVKGRTSAFFFKGKQVKSEEIGRQLGVAYLVRGSVRRDGSKVRITAELTRAATDEAVWSSEPITKELKDVLSVQEEIAGLIAKNLSLKLAEPSGARPAGGESYRLLWQGRFQARKENAEGWNQALDSYRAAIAQNPNDATAWAELARTYVLMGRYLALPSREAFTEARRAADKALAIDERTALGHVALGWIQRTAEWDWAGAERSFRRARALAPSDPIILRDLAVLIFNRGGTEEAVSLLRAAIDLDPLDPGVHGYLGLILMAANRGEEAERSMQRAIELAPQAAEYHSFLCWIQTARGRFDEAAANAEREPVEAYRLAARALVSFTRGDRVAGERSLAEFTAKYGQPPGATPGGAGEPARGGNVFAYLAIVHGAAGKLDQGMAWMERAIEQRETAVAWMRSAVEFKPLRAHPRWPELLRRVGLADEGRP